VNEELLIPPYLTAEFGEFQEIESEKLREENFRAAANHLIASCSFSKRRKIAENAQETTAANERYYREEVGFAARE
jgi:hypothetical protein